MKATIDKAGRVVIPAPIRRQAGFDPGTALDIRYVGGEVRIVRDVGRPQLVERNGRWIARPTTPPGGRPRIDLAGILEEERDRWPS